MLFDGGIWGWVEVDEVKKEAERSVGIKNAADLPAGELYFQYGKEGCTRIRCVPPEDRKKRERPEQPSAG